MFQAAIFLSLSRKQNSWAQLAALCLLLKALRGFEDGMASDNRHTQSSLGLVDVDLGYSCWGLVPFTH